MPYSGLAEVVKNQKVGPEHFLMEVFSPELVREAKPGQFAHVRCTNQMDPLLRRPISLHEINHKKGSVSLLYQVVGRGTRLLSGMQAGGEIDIMGPLGNGFNIPEGARKVLIVGGGIGAAPLFPLIIELEERHIEQTVLLGARTTDDIIGYGHLAALGIRTEVATDDGSMGYKGFVTELAEKHVKDPAGPDYFFACGPNPMLRELIKLTRVSGLQGQVSLEEYMGCGVGACLACVCKTTAGGVNDPEDKNEFEYKKVCTEGPVFDAGEVILDD
ncbi:MAG: dihydroorotate dehydrogenase electron transfer subunit [Firmicutes bacterium HGW-Firmicutes-14]|nr:MAG: dihydroorotate dehydrogenase electron transfer subunit [Firmicutes bacterium HGW-Firmicutes-14]